MLVIRDKYSLLPVFLEPTLDTVGDKSLHERWTAHLTLVQYMGVFLEEGFLITGKNVRNVFIPMLSYNKTFFISAKECRWPDEEPPFLPQSVPTQNYPRSLLIPWSRDLTPVSAVQIFSAPAPGPGPRSRLRLKAGFLCSVECWPVLLVLPVCVCFGNG